MKVERAFLFYLRSAVANCCWHGFCTQNGGPIEVPGHPPNQADWMVNYWTALNVLVAKTAEGAYELHSIENKALDLGPMSWDFPNEVLHDWTEKEALAMLPPGALVLGFASDADRASFTDGLPEEAHVLPRRERLALKPYAPER